MQRRVGDVGLHRAAEQHAGLDAHDHRELALVDDPAGLVGVGDDAVPALAGAAVLRVDVALELAHVLGLQRDRLHVVAGVVLDRVELAELVVLDEQVREDPQAAAPGALHPLVVGALVGQRVRRRPVLEGRPADRVVAVAGLPAVEHGPRARRRSRSRRRGRGSPPGRGDAVRGARAGRSARRRRGTRRPCRGCGRRRCRGPPGSGETPLKGRPLTLVCISGHAAQPRAGVHPERLVARRRHESPPGATLRYLVPIRNRKSLPDLVTVQSACSLGASADSTASPRPSGVVVLGDEVLPVP